jgi:hypothetical protein
VVQIFEMWWVSKTAALTDTRYQNTRDVYPRDKSENDLKFEDYR